MHLLETYSLVSGAAIDKCFIYEEPIELPNRKYITLNTYSNKGNSRQYDFWNQIIDKLQNNPKFDYSIVQIGNIDDPKHPNVDTGYLGKTNFHSLAFLVKNATLHLGIDSFPVHLASHFDIKIVAIYSYRVENCGPYFSSPKNIKIFTPDFTKIKPIYNYNDPYRLINTIDPEIVYTSVLELLEIV